MAPTTTTTPPATETLDAAGRRARVVVLYAHPLLGEGLANLLAREADVCAVAVDERDSAARMAALASHPDMVIVEDTEATRSFETSGSLPVVFVRIDAADGGRLGLPFDDPEALVALARGLVSARSSAG